MLRVIAIALILTILTISNVWFNYYFLQGQTQQINQSQKQIKQLQFELQQQVKYSDQHDSELHKLYEVLQKKLNVDNSWHQLDQQVQALQSSLKNRDEALQKQMMSLIADQVVMLDKKIQQQNDPKSHFPIASVVAFVGDRQKIPNDWLLCQGQALDKVQYPELFAALGTLHGAGYNKASIKVGDFNLPDYRGLFLRGVDDGRGLDLDSKTRQSAAIGAKQGDHVGTIQAGATALPNSQFEITANGEHDHINGLYKNLMYANGRDVVQSKYTHTKLWGSAPNLSDSKPMLPAGKHTHTIQGGDKETRPINTSVYWIIKVR